MKVIKDNIGGVSVLINAIDDPVRNISGVEPDIVETQNRKIEDAYNTAKTIIKNFAKDMGQEFNTLKMEKDSIPPQQMEVEFNLGFSAQAGIWILGIQNDYALKVKMIWETEKA